MFDVTRDRRSGATCHTSNGHPILWKGHLCEGANLTAPIDDNFCLWTRCGQHDVPSNAAHEGLHQEIECPRCKAITEEEAKQPEKTT